VKRLNDIYSSNVGKAGIAYKEGTCKFVSNKVVEVEGKRYTAPHIMIASGSTPASNEFEGADLCMNSDDFFAMEELPETMVVIGGGYIGIELAQILQALGVKVTLLIRSIPLRLVDRDICDVLIENMKKLGLDVRMHTPHKRVVKKEDGTLSVELAEGDPIDCQKCLVALGRPPNLGPLGLENTDIAVERGAVKVDEYQNTSVDGVYAIGDVTN